MKCFYHPNVDAVGICKNCQRGLCPGCAAELPNALACKNRCEAQVIAVERIFSRSLNESQTTSRNSIVRAGLFAIFGIAFIGSGVSLINTTALQGREAPFIYYTLVILGVSCVAFAVYAYYAARKINQ